MARQDVAVTAAPGAYADASTAVAFTAADPVNKEQVSVTGRELILIRNTGAGAATWTATSTDDRHGRSDDIAAESIAAGEVRVFGPVTLEGWRQTDGKLYFEASAATVTFAVIRLP